MHMRALHHLATKYSLLQQWKYYNSITIAILFSPTWTSFEKGKAASIYSQTGQEGRMINTFSQGIITIGQSKSDETDFNQIGANPTDLGTWICSII